MKKRFALHAIFTTLLILACMTGCNNLALKEVKPGQAGNPCSNISEVLHTINGNCGESTSASSARTVFPSATLGNIDHYAVKATRTSDGNEVTARTAQGENTFSLSLPNGTWKIQAFGYNAAGEAGETSDHLVLKSDIKSITLSDETLSESTSLTLVVKPLQTNTGTGSIAVHVGFENSLPIQEIGIRLDNGDEIFRYPESSAIDFKPVNHTLDNVPSGSHTLVISFYDSNHILHYRVIETVNVFDNLCSGNWVDTGRTGHYSTIGSNDEFITYLVLNQGMVDSFKLTNYYVDPVKGSDSGSGSWVAPFLTFEKALSTVKAVNDGTTQYTINLMGDVTVTDATKLELDTTAPNLVIQGDGFNSSGKPYSIDFNGNQGFVITGNNTVTFRNICLKGAETDAGVIDSQSETAQLQYTLEGYVIIEGNLADDGTTLCNLVVPYDTMNDKTKPVRISNTLDSRSRIGVTLSGTKPTADTPVTIAANFSADNNAIPYDVFFSDNNDGIPVLNTDNSVSLAQSGGTILAGEDITITMPDYWIQRPDGGTKTIELSVRKDGNELTGSASYTYTLVKKGTSSSILERSAWTLENGNFTLEIPVSTVPEGIYHFNVAVTVNGIRYSASKEILFSKGQSLSDYAATHTTAPSSGQYVICTKEDMDLLRDMTNGTWTPAGASSAAPATSFSGCTLTMVSDIDLENEEWRGIGTYYPSVNFKGTFDGNGHIIKGLKIKGTYAALFGSISEGVVKNLTVSGTSTASGIIYNSYKTTIENCTSNIVYEIKEAGSCITTISYCDTIKNCVNNGSIKVNYSTGQSYFGAIAGSCTGSTIENCSNYGTITIEKSGSGTYICGIAGKMDENRSNSIKNCVNYGTIIAEDTLTNSPCIAGITGLLSQGPITGCSNYGNIIINSQNSISAGGIFYSAPGPSEITDCKNYGNITATGNAGGIAAECTLKYNFVISGCENHGDIISSNANAGGIVASIAFTKVNDYKLFNLVNSGDITAKANAAGIVNVNSSSSNNFSIINCLNSGNVQTTGTSTEHAAGICTSGKYATLTNCMNTAQVTGTSTYTGGIATGSDLSGSTFTNCFYHYGKVLSGSTFGTGRGSNSAVSDETGNVEQCGPLFTTTGSRLGISPARNGISDIAKLMNDWIKSSSGGNDSSFSTYRQWGYTTNGELTFTTYTDYTPFVIPPVITSASASSLSGYTSSDTVQIQIPASTTVNDINSLLSGNDSGSDVKLILDLSSIQGNIKDITVTLPNVIELILPPTEQNFSSNLFQEKPQSLKKLTIQADIPSPDPYNGKWLFQNCTSIETVIFTEGVTTINDGMFAGCTSLKTVVLPSTLTKIGYHAFANSAIEEIIIPAKVKEIQHYAFFDTNATPEQLSKLKRVIFENTSGWSVKNGDTVIQTVDVSDPEKNAEMFKGSLNRTEDYWFVKN